MYVTNLDEEIVFDTIKKFTGYVNYTIEWVI